MWRVTLAALGGMALCALLASCVQDYAKSTPQVVEVLIVDKRHEPGHYVTSCSTNGKGVQSCSMRWVPPTWSIEYADERRWTTSVSEGTYEAIRIGDKKVLRFDLGGGYWHARYSERFMLTAQSAEASYPTR